MKRCAIRRPLGLPADVCPPLRGLLRACLRAGSTGSFEAT